MAASGSSQAALSNLFEAVQREVHEQLAARSAALDRREQELNQREQELLEREKGLARPKDANFGESSSGPDVSSVSQQKASLFGSSERSFPFTAHETKAESKGPEKDNAATGSNGKQENWSSAQKKNSLFVGGSSLFAKDDDDCAESEGSLWAGRTAASSVAGNSGGIVSQNVPQKKNNSLFSDTDASAVAASSAGQEQQDAPQKKNSLFGDTGARSVAASSAGQEKQDAPQKKSSLFGASGANPVATNSAGEFPQDAPQKKNNSLFSDTGASSVAASSAGQEKQDAPQKRNSLFADDASHGSQGGLFGADKQATPTSLFAKASDGAGSSSSTGAQGPRASLFGNTGAPKTNLFGTVAKPSESASREQGNAAKSAFGKPPPGRKSFADLP